MSGKQIALVTRAAGSNGSHVVDHLISNGISHRLGVLSGGLEEQLKAEANLKRRPTCINLARPQNVLVNQR